MFTSKKMVISSLRLGYYKKISQCKKDYINGQLDVFVYTAIIDRYMFLIYKLEGIKAHSLADWCNESLYVDVRL